MTKKPKRLKKELPKCSSCETSMTKDEGYAGTGLCGVCATGESSMLKEFGTSW